MSNDYHNYVIKNGEYIGDFEKMYQNCEDPWGLLENEGHGQENTFLKRACEAVKQRENQCNIVDIGCGLGASIKVVENYIGTASGIDISKSAIERARVRLPAVKFCIGGVVDFMEHRNECSAINIEEYNVIVLCNVTWYMMNHIKEFKQWLKLNWKNKYFVHILATYAPSVQKYGANLFVNHDEILDWWDLEYMEHGKLTKGQGKDMAITNYFLAKT